MNEIKLSKRLTTLVEWIPEGANLADIGSDHAYLPTFAIQTGKISQAIAGEVNQGPFESAQETVQEFGLDGKIEVRKGDGLEVIKKGEVSAVVIAGMGGALIRSILEKGKERLSPETFLILQPNNGEKTLRDWLVANSWEIVKETILEEDGHVYEALAAEKTSKKISLSPKELLFGPFLMSEKNPVFLKKWTRELDKWNKIYEGVRGQAEDSADKLNRLQEILDHIELIEEVLR